jgi:hypothetical protein
MKNLLLVKKNNTWKIKEEKWSPQAKEPRP